MTLDCIKSGAGIMQPFADGVLIVGSISDLH